VSTPEKPNPDAKILLVWDGVEYEVPTPPTPREDGRIRRICGRTFVDIFRGGGIQALELEAFVALLAVAMTRAEGACDENALLDDPDFVRKFELRVVNPEADAGPPAEAGPVAGDQPAPPPPTNGSAPTTTGDPVPTGHQT
jgi:hypothetical protein